MPRTFEHSTIEIDTLSALCAVLIGRVQNYSRHINCPMETEELDNDLTKATQFLRELIREGHY